MHPVTKQAIIDAHERIKPHILRTPVLNSETIDAFAGCRVFFKCENLQKIGAFKARGAMNAVLSLGPDKRAKGVATHSSGNHAQAIARATHIQGIKSFIVMPRTAPEVKKRGVRYYGGEIFECEPTLESRENTLREVLQKTGATEIHPFNNYDVICGQATAAKELLEEVDLDFILVPVGGGGLLSGTALTARYFSPRTAVIAGEPEGADDAYRSLLSGKIEPSQSDTIADGLLTSLGDKTFPIISENVRRIITVSDQEIIEAMRLVWEQLKVIAEPSGCVPLAALLKERTTFSNKNVGVILSGGNVDLEKTFKLLAP